MTQSIFLQSRWECHTQWSQHSRHVALKWLNYFYNRILREKTHKYTFKGRCHTRILSGLELTVGVVNLHIGGRRRRQCLVNVERRVQLLLAVATVTVSLTTVVTGSRSSLPITAYVTATVQRNRFYSGGVIKCQNDIQKASLPSQQKQFCRLTKIHKIDTQNRRTKYEVIT